MPGGQTAGTTETGQVETRRMSHTSNATPGFLLGIEHNSTAVHPLRHLSVLAVIRAFLGYCFLVLIMRTAGRRPGKQLTPMEFVLIFFSGGLTLTTMVADDRSFTNALCQIMTVALTHYAIAWMRQRSPRFGSIVDGTPLVLLSKGEWHVDTMRRMRIEQEDVLATIRDKGLKTFDDIEYAFLERNGEISVIQSEKE